MAQLQKNENTFPPITAIVLSGGAGTRAGGVDKGLHQYKGKTLLEQVITILQPQVQSIIISANRNLQQYKEFGFPVVTDDFPESYQGPLAGIAAAVTTETPQTERNYLICPCDTPYLPADYVARLQAALGSADAKAAVVHDGRRRQNLHCLIAGRHIGSLLDFYQQGGRAMHHWLSRTGALEVDFSRQENAFKNLNTL